MNDQYDLVIVGGGINGCGIARDAAGRGLKVLLVEQGDIAQATSSGSSKLIHGGLRYLEQYEFCLVREALQEREVLLRIAPHIIHPLEFILPHDDSMRPAWMLRVGLWIYDHLGGKISLPSSHGVNLRDTPFGAGLREGLRRGFVYSDARVDDARLTLLNALAAREHGAEVLTRTRCIAGRRGAGHWEIMLRDTVSWGERIVQARGVVNAAGPWVMSLLDEALHVSLPATVRLVKGSHIVVPRVHDGKHACILQNDDRRVTFIIPFEERFSLIGTTDVTIATVEEASAITPQEIAYLIRAANRALAQPIAERDVVWSYSAVRPLYDDGSADPSQITRDYVLKVDAQDGGLPLLSVFGGKITTYRRLAEHALHELAPFYPEMKPSWSSGEALPGGDFDDASVELAKLHARYALLPGDYLAKLFARHGTRTPRVLGDAATLDALNPFFGNGANLLAAREIDYLVREEWAREADDILWRRTKCGLHMTTTEREAAADCIRQSVARLGSTGA
jgi:glycerol-3-phosphate dehydrogenase